MSFLEHMSLPQKIAVLGTIFLVMAAFPASFYIMTIASEVDVAEQEVAGVAPIVSIHEMVKLTQQHRGISGGILGGNESLVARLPELQSQMNNAAVNVDAAFKAANVSVPVNSDWSAVKQRIGELANTVNRRQLSFSDSAKQHTDLIGDMLLIAERIQDEFGLSLDPVAGTYFLINATMVNAPKLTESMGRMRAAGTTVLASGELTTVQRATLMGQYSNINEYFQEMTRNLEKATSADSYIKAAIETRAAEVRQQIDNILVITNTQLLNAEQLTFAADKYFDEYTNAIDNIYAFNAVAIQSLVEALQFRITDMQQSVYLLFGLMVLALGFGVFLSILIVRSITKPMNKAIAIANAVAAGDLTTRIDARSNNETGKLLQALKQMNNNLIDLVGKVRLGTDSITNATEEITAGNLNLSQRTEKQSASLEQTASAMEELTSTVKQNADNAKQANQLAVGASDVAVKGGEVVGQVVQTMNEINESSKKIVDIISVIDSIAFQTNILALNAAVEAARAGEQGRGFAVVATEVRTLAQRSASAAKEIKELISNSVSKVDVGTQLVDEAGSTMDEIVKAVRRVTDIMGEITAASQEQSLGIEQVNQAISQMDTATQQNAALVEEAAATAELMQEQSQELVDAVTVFKLSMSSHRVAHQSRRPKSVVTELPVQKKQKTNADDMAAVIPDQPRKAVAGGKDDTWEQF